MRMVVVTVVVIAVVTVTKEYSATVCTYSMCYIIIWLQVSRQLGTQWCWYRQEIKKKNNNTIICVYIYMYCVYNVINISQVIVLSCWYSNPIVLFLNFRSFFNNGVSQIEILSRGSFKERRVEKKTQKLQISQNVEEL